MSFALFGIRIDISYILACVVVLFIANDRTGMILPVFISVLCHECAHLAAIVSFGCKIKRIKLIVGTIGVEYKGSLNRVKQAVATLTGPLSNLLLAVLFFIFKNQIWFGVNLILAVYNLLPVKGLDGGELIKLILSLFLNERTVNMLLLVLTLSVFMMLIIFFIKLNILNMNNYSAILFLVYLILPLILKKLG